MGRPRFPQSEGERAASNLARLAEERDKVKRLKAELKMERKAQADAAKRLKKTERERAKLQGISKIMDTKNTAVAAVASANSAWKAAMARIGRGDGVPADRSKD